jgi:hypothetical protein
MPYHPVTVIVPAFTTRARRRTPIEYFVNISFAVLHTLLSPMSIYCSYKPTVKKIITLRAVNGDFSSYLDKIFQIKVADLNSS